MKEKTENFTLKLNPIKSDLSKNRIYQKKKVEQKIIKDSIGIYPFKALNFIRREIRNTTAPNKNLPINEDMYIAHKLITNDYKIKYCADSVVYHSHKFMLKQLYYRYYLSGKFMAQNSYLDQYKTVRSGRKLARYVLRRALCQFNVLVLLRFMPDMIARWLGMRNGRKTVRSDL